MHIFPPIGKKYAYFSPNWLKIQNCKKKGWQFSTCGAQPLIIINFNWGKNINQEGWGAKYEFQIYKYTLQFNLIFLEHSHTNYIRNSNLKKVTINLGGAEEKSAAGCWVIRLSAPRSYINFLKCLSKMNYTFWWLFSLPKVYFLTRSVWWNQMQYRLHEGYFFLKTNCSWVQQIISCFL